MKYFEFVDELEKMRLKVIDMWREGGNKRDFKGKIVFEFYRKFNS